MSRKDLIKSFLLDMATQAENAAKDNKLLDLSEIYKDDISLQSINPQEINDLVDRIDKATNTRENTRRFFHILDSILKIIT